MTRLDADKIRRRISGATAQRIDQLEVFDEIASTNSYLLRQDSPATGRCRVAIANHQTAGRGRRERRWESPAGTGVYLSMACTIDAPPNNLPCLTLAIGVAAVGALRELNVQGVSLKWPNDLMANDAKLGGILTEYQGGTVVIGIGINVNLEDRLRPSVAAGRIGRVVDLASIVDRTPSRESLSAVLVEHLVLTVEGFADKGFPQFHDAWRASDWLLGRDVIVELSGGRLRGTADGIDERGALVVVTPDGRHEVTSGSVSTLEFEDVVA